MPRSNELEFTAEFRGGSGEPLLLLHGGTATWHTWEPVLGRLTAAHDVLAPTFPGHLGGPAFSEPVSIARFADAAETAMDVAGWDTAHVAGNSLGGWVAMELATRGRARSVVAFSPAGGWSATDRRVRRIFLSTDRQLRLGRRLLPTVMRSGRARRFGFRNVALYGDRLSPEAALRTAVGALGADLAAGKVLFDEVVRVLPDPGVPALLAWSGEDRLVPSPRYSDAWRRAAPYAEWRVLPGVGHVPMIDDPDLVAETILGWAAAAKTQA
jgi:pimeloyl-ACP methyl ester carboxylesterase